ncbi:TolC family protein [Geomonas sp. Red69]|uniref:TolC family protein n=1 Tax=Geomonas diazotrophica TaxID=2843197 RepID=A0ABX8JQB8_9BACT|nr:MULTISPECIES: TolC family protein [Geomonas]MBU5637335.1 TolC family protein [Geomonas diazotrophica]QWV99622.1 TolC family protein [Geomonas nitrogeniifigens]
MATDAFRGTRLVVAVALSLLAAVPVLAEPHPLSLHQAVEAALNNNPDLVSLRKEAGILDAASVRAGVLPNPTLEVEAATGALTGSSDDSNLSLGISQEFLLGDKRPKRRAVVERDLAAYRWQVADRERALKEQVQGAFCDVLLAQERLGLARRSIDLNRQLLQVAEDRLAAGDIPELEMYLVKVELTRSEGSLIELQRGLLDSKSKLFSFLALGPGLSPALSGTLDGKEVQARGVAELKQFALQSRPDLKALQAALGKTDAEIALAEAEGIPNLTAGIAVSRDTSSMEIGGVEGKETSYTIGVKLSMPIPLFDRNQAGRQEARARRSSAEIRLQGAAASAEREVESAHASLVNAEKVLSLYRSDILRQLDENLKLTQEAYRLGEVGILAVIEEQKKYFEVSDSYLAALHARQVALNRLESAVAADINGGTQ